MILTAATLIVYEGLRARELEILGMIQDACVLGHAVKLAAIAEEIGVRGLGIIALESACNAYSTNRQTQCDELARVTAHWSELQESDGTPF